MRRIAWRAVRAHLGQFAMSIVAVALGVAFVTGTFSLREMLSSTFDEIVGASTTADAYVRVPDDGSNVVSGERSAAPGLPLSLAGTLERVPGVQAVIPSLSGPITLVGASGTAVRSTQAPSFALAYDRRDPSVAGLTGRAPVGRDEIAVERHTLDSSGLHVGDRTKVVLLGDVHEVTVVGAVDFGAPMAGATIVLLDPAVEQAAFAPAGTTSSFQVYADKSAGLTEQQLVDRLAPVASDAHAQALTGAAMRAETSSQISKQLGFVSTFLLVFALLALFVGAFIIANTFTMSVRQRMREFALLRAVGASPRQVFGSILTQSALVGVVGSAIGVLGGLGLVELIGVVLQRMDMTLSTRVPLSASTVLIGLVVGTGVSVAAASLPARRAAVVPPVEAMRDEVTVNERSLRLRAWAGLALVVAGAAAVVVAAVRPHLGSAGTLLGVGAGFVLIGTLVVGPVVVPAVVRLLAAPAVAWLGPVGRLARGNVVRNPRRAANTAGALTIGMALVGAAAVIAASTQASVGSLVSSEVSADYVLRTGMSDTVAPALLQKVQALPSVQQAEGFPWTHVLAAVGRAPTGADGQALVAVEPTMVGSLLRPSSTDGPVAQTLASGELVADKLLAKDKGWKIGDTVSVTGPLGEKSLRIGAIARSGAVGQALWASPSVVDTLVPAAQQPDTTVLVKAAAGADLNALRTQLTDLSRPYYVVSVMDSKQFVDGLAAQVNQMLDILYALLGLSVAIAVLGIVNTLALSVIERTREIGMLRAVGLGRLQLSGVITVESVLTAVCGTVIGLAVGIGLAASLPRLYADQGLSQLSVPGSSLAGMLVLAVLVGVVAAVWPAVRAARLPVLDAVAQE